MNKLMFGSVVFAAFALGAHAGTVTWKADGAEGLVDNSSWQEAANFVGGVAPVAGDIVVIPADKTVTIDDDSAAFVSTLSRIQPANDAFTRKYSSIVL